MVTFAGNKQAAARIVVEEKTLCSTEGNFWEQTREFYSRAHTQDLEGSAYKSVIVFVLGNDTRGGAIRHQGNHYFGMLAN